MVVVVGGIVVVVVGGTVVVVVGAVCDSDLSVEQFIKNCGLTSSFVSISNRTEEPSSRRKTIHLSTVFPSSKQRIIPVYVNVSELQQAIFIFLENSQYFNLM